MARPIAAARFVKQVFHVVEHLADLPESGRVVPEFADPNIREVIAFPKTASASDLMFDAPSELGPKQLRELHIRVVMPEAKQS